MTARQQQLTDSLNAAIDMLRYIESGKNYSAADFYNRILNLECALNPDLTPSAAIRHFYNRETK